MGAPSGTVQLSSARPSAPTTNRPFRGIGQFREEGHVGRQRLPVAPAHEHTETQRLAGPEDAAFAEHIGVDAVGVAGLPLRGEARVLRSGKLLSTYEVRVTDAEGGLVAVATITGYGVGARLPLGDA